MNNLSMNKKMKNKNDNTFPCGKIGIDCECLESKTWKKFIEELEKNKFRRPSIIYNQNSTLYDWICKKLQ